MARYQVIIGGRELEVQAPDATAAVGAAMQQYPGQLVTGYALIEDESDQGEPEGGEDE